MNNSMYDFIPTVSMYSFHQSPWNPTTILLCPLTDAAESVRTFLSDIYLDKKRVAAYTHAGKSLKMSHFISISFQKARQRLIITAPRVSPKYPSLLSRTDVIEPECNFHVKLYLFLDQNCISIY